MATRVVVICELWVCDPCAFIISCGEDTSQEDGGLAHGARMTAHYGAGVMALALDNSEPELESSSMPCGACGEDLAGGRRPAVELGRRVVPVGRPLGRLE